ncbi:hypothetical protein, partial [Mesorhizobium sp.]|uniref:hypothetical protein n=1 Tax=Mesorhizobium sp. TaxID=1871066 RepID=UPI0026010947
TSKWQRQDIPARPTIEALTQPQGEWLQAQASALMQAILGGRGLVKRLLIYANAWEQTIATLVERAGRMPLCPNPL